MLNINVNVLIISCYVIYCRVFVDLFDWSKSEDVPIWTRRWSSKVWSSFFHVVSSSFADVRAARNQSLCHLCAPCLGNICRIVWMQPRHRVLKRVSSMSPVRAFVKVQTRTWDLVPHFCWGGWSAGIQLDQFSTSMRVMRRHGLLTIWKPLTWA